MPFIRTIDLQAATGLLKKVYEDAVRRAGKIWNIIKVQSINPQTLRTSLGFYSAVMHGESPLSRAQREMIAVVVSRTNNCFY